MPPRRDLSAKAETAEPEEPDGDVPGFGVGELAVADPDWSWTIVKAELRTASEAMSCHLRPLATDPVVKRRRLTTVKRQRTPSPEYGVDHDSEIEQHFMEDPEEPMEESMEAPMEDNYEHFEIPLLHNIYANPQPSSAPTIARELYANPEATPSRLRHEFRYANPQATPTCVTTSAVLASSSSASDLEPRNLITVWTDVATRPIQGELLGTLMYRLRERCPGHRCWIDPINNELWALANTEPQARQFVRNTHCVEALDRTVILQSCQSILSEWPHGFLS